ncbi:hypothetical protein TI05_17090 [Achromatium sp. WMS3]|nr:hypothetical protein TI05_17090 [Achromatium sp. WMS3]
MININSVLTLQEVADYLKISEDKIQKQVTQGSIPGRKIGNEWRFLKTAIDDWLQHYDSRAIFLKQAGALSDDETLEELCSMIYTNRTNTETEFDNVHS